MADKQEWWVQVDPVKLSEEARYRILRYVVERHGGKRVMELTGVSRVTLWRLLERKSPVKPEYVGPLLRLLSLQEFEELVAVGERLRSLGIVREDGAIDYSLALEILAIAKHDEYLKNAILRFVVQEFREDLKRMLGVSFAGIKLEWTRDFEEFLAERKRRKKVKSPETVKYYKSLFTKYLQGRELSEELIEYVASHENKWLRNVFRHYVQYLYHRRRISGETMAWILEVVPSRSYRLDVRPYPIEPSDVRRTVEHLRRSHRLYYAIYRLMLESGARLSHALLMLENWRPEERVEIPGTSIAAQRLVCFSAEGFCRYYMGLREVSKPCEWIYFSRDTLELIMEFAPRHVNRHQVTKYAERNNLVLPKYLRKIAWRIMVKTMSRETARFAQSRFGELSVSEARYEDLLRETDSQYPRYLESLNRLVLAEATEV